MGSSQKADGHTKFLFVLFIAFLIAYGAFANWLGRTAEPTMGEVYSSAYIACQQNPVCRSKI